MTMIKLSSERERDFCRGFIAALVTAITLNNEVNTMVREIWESGGYRFKDVVKHCDEYDISIIKKYRGALCAYQSKSFKY